MTFFKEFIDYFKADDDIIKDRIRHCRGCKYITPKFRCIKCGCFMKLKTKVAGARCPIGKW
tara:strand:+ start:359 stop:541 length:183 start_codon:yes stop_codon:yes gene_type:complete